MFDFQIILDLRDEKLIYPSPYFPLESYKTIVYLAKLNFMFLRPS